MAKGEASRRQPFLNALSIEGAKFNVIHKFASLFSDPSALLVSCGRTGDKSKTGYRLAELLFELT